MVPGESGHLEPDQGVNDCIAGVPHLSLDLPAQVPREKARKWKISRVRGENFRG